MLLNASYYLNDKKGIKEVKVPLLEGIIERKGLKKIKGTFIEELLEDAKLL